jgi:hypothetical protein
LHLIRLHSLLTLTKRANICLYFASRSYFVLFFELFVILVTAVVSCLGAPRLDAGRKVLAHFFSIATVLIMTALNIDINLFVVSGMDH